MFFKILNSEPFSIAQEAAGQAASICGYVEKTPSEKLQNTACGIWLLKIAVPSHAVWGGKTLTVLKSTRQSLQESVVSNGHCLKGSLSRNKNIQLLTEVVRGGKSQMVGR